MKTKMRLLYSKIMKGLKINQIQTEDIKIIYVYRYLSWALTSLVYLIGPPHSIIYFKLGVVISLFICSKIVIELIIKLNSNKESLRVLLFIETLGIAVLLIPTGGMESPFMWYSLNPILVGVRYLPLYFSWLNLIFYLTVGSAVSYFFFNSNNNTIMEMLWHHSSQFLVFALITIAMQLLANFARRLYEQTMTLQEQKKTVEEINKKLQIYNDQKQEAMEYIMSLYQIIEAFNNHSASGELFNTLAVYTAKLTKTRTSFFLLYGPGVESSLFTSNRGLNPQEKVGILNQLKNFYMEKGNHKPERGCSLLDRDYLIAPIQSNGRDYGVVGIQMDDTDDDEEKLRHCTRFIEFISGLSAVILDRFNLENLEDQLLIMEEQNRIANEIHDSVTQRLFSINYSIYALMERREKLSEEKLSEVLREIRESSCLALQELRNSIYRLSSAKKGDRALYAALKSYLDSISKLNGVRIELSFTGDENLLSLQIKKAINRIIREAAGNAVRHGKCKNLQVELEIGYELVRLKIIDDGVGFDTEKLSPRNSGLGLYNMRRLVNSFKGNFKINSKVGSGTEIEIAISNTSTVNDGGLAV
ncbi:MAG: hypothetical protein GX022_00575 [Clostridiaceae bacterium]|nr:hypothetical protein [Clostridiaceae bacterium]